MAHFSQTNNMATSSPIPPIIASISAYQLFRSSTLQSATESFFDLAISDQIALVAVTIGLVFTIANKISDSKNEKKEDDEVVTFSYPFKEMEASKTEKEKFLCLFPVLRDSIAKHMATKHEMPTEAVDWVVEMMNYTCPGGKLNRGMTVLAVARSFAEPRALSPLEEARACVLGWSIEFLQAFFLVADDLMDDSKTRRGAPCWYLLPKVKTIAVNDSFLLESFVFTFINQHFKKEKYYTDLLELFLEVVQQTECGQLLDLTSQPADTSIVDLSRFTIERYKSIVKYKTAFYSFYLPVAIGMIVSGVSDKDSYKVARRICCLMGEYFQIQDDVLDCYGTPEVIGKGKNM